MRDKAGNYRASISLLAAVSLSATSLVIAAAPAPATVEKLVHRVGVVDTTTGQWHLEDAALGANSFYYGNPNDIPFMGDWDCDQEETPGLYRSSDGFVYLRNSNTQGVADITFFFGNPGDVPLAGDFNGDGCDTVSVYRPETSEVFIVNALGVHGGGLGMADFSYLFGNPGDMPFVGDFDGDGVDTVGLHRESTGRVYFRNSQTTGIADADFIYGDPGDKIIAGDWTGDGVDSVAIFRPSNDTFYLRYSNSAGFADETMAFASGQLPVAGATPGDVARFSVVPCAAPASYSLLNSIVGTSGVPATPSNANGVLSLSHSSSPTCERSIITLGVIDPTRMSGVRASSLPAGVVVTNHGPRIHVRLPGIDRVLYDETETILGRPAYVVRSPFPSTDLYIDTHYFENRFTRVLFPPGSPQIIIDTIAAPTDPTLALGPVIGEAKGFGAVLREPIQLRPGGPGVETLPIVVTGYGRPFEAAGAIEIREQAPVPGTGAPASATFSGTDFLGTVTGSSYAYMTSDYAEAWGEFTFTIESILPEDYEIFVGEFSPKDGTPIGVYHNFTVEP
jgi:hypothetical protein